MASVQTGTGIATGNGTSMEITQLPSIGTIMAIITASTGTITTTAITTGNTRSTAIRTIAATVKMTEKSNVVLESPAMGKLLWYFLQRLKHALFLQGFGPAEAVPLQRSAA